MMDLVLVVDDDDEIRAALSILLTTSGYRVVEARDGRDALAQLGALASAPSVVLLDMMMPVMNGSEFLSTLREDGRLAHLRVLIFSAQRTSASDALGTCGSVSKTTPPEELLRRIRACVESAAA